MQNQIHDFQASILRELLFKPGARFSDLKKVDVTNDHFTFHINKLVSEGLVDKTDGKYSLTIKGKEFANRLDTDSLKFERQAKMGVALHAVREKDGELQFLMHKRLKEPFYGWIGSHSGKMRWGETPLETAKREFFEESGLTGDFTLKGIVKTHHYDTEGKLLEDKYFFVFRIENVTGELLEKVEEGENIWMNEEQIRNIEYTYATFEQMMEVLDAPSLVYVEREQIAEKY